MKHRSSLTLAAFGLLAATAAGAQTDTAVVYIGVDATGTFGIDNAVNYLDADPRFSSVGLIDAGAATPTLAALQAFDSLLIVTDNRLGTNTGGGQGTQLGNILDDYVVGGGRVVFSTFSGNSDIGVDGDILAIAPFTSGGTNAGAGPLNFATALPDVVFDGVTSFDSSFASTINIANGGTILASYQTGTLAVISNLAGDVLFINAFPGTQSDYSNGTDFGRLFANALIAAGPSNPVPEPGSLALFGGMAAVGGLALRRRARR